MEQPTLVPPQSVIGSRVLDRAARKHPSDVSLSILTKGDVETPFRPEQQRLDLNHPQAFGSHRREAECQCPVTVRHHLCIGDESNKFFDTGSRNKVWSVQTGESLRALCEVRWRIRKIERTCCWVIVIQERLDKVFLYFS